MLIELVKTFNNREELELRSQFVVNGNKGLKFGLQAHLLDAARLIKECWDQLKSTTIAGCWIRAKCLPDIMNAQLFGEKELEKHKVK